MEILLKKNELLDFGTDLCGLIVFCQSGTCWLTQAGDGRDHILHAGQSFSAGMKGQLVVTATQESRLRLVAEPVKLKCDTLWQQLCCSN